MITCAVIVIRIYSQHYYFILFLFVMFTYRSNFFKEGLIIISSVGFYNMQWTGRPCILFVRIQIIIRFYKQTLIYDMYKNYLPNQIQYMVYIMFWCKSLHSALPEINLLLIVEESRGFV